MALIRRRSVWTVFSAGILVGVILSITVPRYEQEAQARTSLASLKAELDALKVSDEATFAEIEKLKADITKLSLKTDPITVDTNNNFYLTGVNVHIRNGTGTTDGPPNGTGNLCLGYDRDDGADNKTGSHNMIIGDNHTYTSWGGLCQGEDHELSAPVVVVVGGSRNRVRFRWGAAFGGRNNLVDAPYAVAAGGKNNVVGGPCGVSVGGVENDIFGEDATIVGGSGNFAPGRFAAIFGGKDGLAGAPGSSVIGGCGGRAFASDSLSLGGRDLLIDVPKGVVLPGPVVLPEAP